ncbi:MAG: oxidoreductase [Lysobacteraceae bacterium]|nr:MAG: oxidoreductase [Xanthomonadaceae bacterium]
MATAAITEQHLDPLLNVALVGYGFVGKVFHAPLIRRTPGLRLRCVVSSDAAKVHADHPDVRVVASAETAFADPAIDLVVIAAPNALHAPLAIAALGQGKHVVVDKPFTVTAEEARRVAEHARRAGRIASVFQNRRWDADFLALRRLLADGSLGEIAEFHSHFDRHRPAVAPRWRESGEPGSGLWYDLGPHLLDQAVQLFGMPDAVFADLARQRVGALADDYFHVLLRYRHLRVVLHAGSLVAGNGLRFAVHGSAGSFIKHGLDPQEAALRSGATPGQPGWGRDPQPGWLHPATAAGGSPAPATPLAAMAGTDGDYRRYYQAMHSAITAGRPPPVGIDEAVQLMELLEAGLLSAAQGREVACGAPAVTG